MTTDPVNHRVDRALALLQGMSAREASARHGFAASTIGDWRRRRSRGDQVLEVRGRNRVALERLLEGPVAQPIPVGVAVVFRRR